MTIAAVVVTYNRLALLKECLDAISRQTYQVYKMVVVNNASTDGTTEFLQKIDNKHLFVKSFELKKMVSFCVFWKNTVKTLIIIATNSSI